MGKKTLSVEEGALEAYGSGFFDRCVPSLGLRCDSSPGADLARQYQKQCSP